ncbi:hypothetical protein KGQ29_03555 [Patescibacteria group bacterium]|nr:hypothetical protein [Patescibacteria group bacterium]
MFQILAIAGIIRDIRPWIPYETDSELTKVNYRISQITIPSWPKGIFAQS